MPEPGEVTSMRKMKNEKKKNKWGGFFFGNKNKPSSIKSCTVVFNYTRVQNRVELAHLL